MATFRVYPDGNGGAQESVEAPSARRAAELYWEAQAIAINGTAANEEERLIVEHSDGPRVDPSATWITDEDGTFARFDVSVVHVEVSAVEATGKR